MLVAEDRHDRRGGREEDCAANPQQLRPGHSRTFSRAGVEIPDVQIPE